MKMRLLSSSGASGAGRGRLAMHRSDKQNPACAAVTMTSLSSALVCVFPPRSPQCLLPPVAPCASGGQSRGANLESVFRCTNGITEAKMAAGER